MSFLLNSLMQSLVTQANLEGWTNLEASFNMNCAYKTGKNLSELVRKSLIVFGCLMEGQAEGFAILELGCGKSRIATCLTCKCPRGHAWASFWSSKTFPPSTQLLLHIHQVKLLFNLSLVFITYSTILLFTQYHYLFSQDDQAESIWDQWPHFILFCH